MRRVRLACLSLAIVFMVMAMRPIHALGDDDGDNTEECDNTIRIDGITPQIGYAIRENELTVQGCFGEEPNMEQTEIVIMDLPCPLKSLTTTEAVCTFPAQPDSEGGYADVKVISESHGTTVEKQDIFVYLNPKMVTIMPKSVHNDVPANVDITYTGPSLPQEPVVRIGGEIATVRNFDTESNIIEVLSPKIDVTGPQDIELYHQDPHQDPEEPVPEPYLIQSLAAGIEYLPASSGEPVVESVDPYFLLASDEFNKNREIKIEGRNLVNAVKVKFQDTECENFKLIDDPETEGQVITCSFPACDPAQCAAEGEVRVLGSDDEQIGSIAFAFFKQPSVGGKIEPFAFVPGNFADEVTFTLPINEPIADGVVYSFMLTEEQEIPLLGAALNTEDGKLTFSPPVCVETEDPEDKICEFDQGYSLVMRNLWGHLLYKSPDAVFTYQEKALGPTILTEKDMFIGFSGDVALDGTWFKHFGVSKAVWNPSNDIEKQVEATIEEVTQSSITLSSPPCGYPNTCEEGTSFDVTLFDAKDEVVGVGAGVFTYHLGALFEGTVGVTFADDVAVDEGLTTKSKAYIVNKFGSKADHVMVTPVRGKLVTLSVVDYIENRDENTKFTVSQLRDDIVAPDSPFFAEVGAISKVDNVHILQYCPNGKFLADCKAPVPSDKKKKKGFDGAIIAYILIPIAAIILGVFVYRKWKARKEQLNVQGLLDDHAAYNEVHDY